MAKSASPLLMIDPSFSAHEAHDAAQNPAQQRDRPESGSGGGGGRWAATRKQVRGIPTISSNDLIAPRGRPACASNSIAFQN